MLTWKEADHLEGHLKASIVALNKDKIVDATLIEVIDRASLWPEPFEHLAPFAPLGTTLDSFIARNPLLVCAIASEIGFRFEGVGTVFWDKFSRALGVPIDTSQRQNVGKTFEMLATHFRLARPSKSAFSNHFSIMSWPIANALLPIDLVGSVARMLARAPVGALPAASRKTNFSSLRAWASAAEGARLADWLRFEPSTARVLTALLNENRGAVLSDTSYLRLCDALAAEPEAFRAARAARLRTRGTKMISSPEQTLGRLTAARDPLGVRIFVSWPALPPALLEEARGAARAAGWRPQLWGAGGFLHPDAALSAGPFSLALQTTPTDASAAYPSASEIFGAGSEIAAALAARTIDWSNTLLFDANDNRTHAEQRFDVLTGGSGIVWIATKDDQSFLGRLRKLGSNCGYSFFEADLTNDGDRAVLAQEGLLCAKTTSLLARHPIDAIGAQQSVVRPNRPFLLYQEVPTPGSLSLPQVLAAGDQLDVSETDERPRLRCESATTPQDGIVDLILFERDSAFEALVERRLQLRVESRLPLKDVLISASLEIAGVIIARGRDLLASLPVIVPAASTLLAPLYDDAVRAKLLQCGRGELRLAIGRYVEARIALERPATSVEWIGSAPHLVGGDLDGQIVTATARKPYQFVAASAIEPPMRGAAAFGLLLADGRLADPIRLFTSDVFNFGDITAHFGEDLGSRRMFDHGRGVGDLARSRVAWARALCTSVADIGAKARIVRQLEEPLIYDLCGKNWLLAEQASKVASSDPHEALWDVAIEFGLVAVPDCASSSEIAAFATAFRNFAIEQDPEWPIVRAIPVDGAMDDALNAAFSETIVELHRKGALLDVEDDFDFGSPAEDWERAASEALRRVRRSALVRLIVPSKGARDLSLRSYTDLSIFEVAEDLSAWTKSWALPRGQLSLEIAAGALQLWLSPSACNDVEAVVHTLAADPFVSRATRYASLRLGTAAAEFSQ